MTKKTSKTSSLEIFLYLVMLICIVSYIWIDISPFFEKHTYDNVYILKKEYDEYHQEYVIHTRITFEDRVGLQYLSTSTDLYEQLEVDKTYSLETKGCERNKRFLHTHEEIVKIN